ncbi:MAG: hypothetical protein OEZ06_04790 [Myxococcales bacterium]|nr:hypothetical protein [Myxococcales bacterium]
MAGANAGTCSQSAITYADVIAPLIAERCLPCHSSALEGDARLGAPVGVDFDTEALVLQHGDRIMVRAVVDRTMPPGSPLSDCEAAALQQFLEAQGAADCVADCSGRSCGSDGCSGSCGECTGGLICDADGSCVAGSCTPDCVGRSCGDDGCGGSCGSCGSGQACSLDGRCECAPDCSGRDCGDDGCGGSCGNCTGTDFCDVQGLCRCVPDCGGKVCGDDGCGGSCGLCPIGEGCSADASACECVPNCGSAGATYNCGDDGCGGSCGVGTCGGATPYCKTTVTGGRMCAATCTADCGGKVCGDDGCGGSCGPGCGAGDYCDASGQCQCAPSCVGVACGDNGCGGSCGSCAEGTSCNSGSCECTADCTGRECGSDGCGGSCGSCDGALVCNSAGSCVEQCVGSCAGKVCGDDGCGGSCGSCAAGQSCNAGSCEWGDYSFAADVFPLFDGCVGLAPNTCHSSGLQAQDLDLSSAATAYSQLVGAASTQCTNRTRVVAGDAAASYLVNKLSGVDMCFGSRMPKGGTPLSAADMAIITAWIESGANP